MKNELHVFLTIPVKQKPCLDNVLCKPRSIQEFWNLLFSFFHIILGDIYLSLNTPLLMSPASFWHDLGQNLFPDSINRSTSGLGVWALAWRMCSIAAGQSINSSLTQLNRLNMSLAFKPLIHSPFWIFLNCCTVMLDYLKSVLKTMLWSLKQINSGM